MNFYECPYVDVIPFRNGNEYNECYKCGVTGSGCKCYQCEITPEQAEELLKEKVEKR